MLLSSSRSLFLLQIRTLTTPTLKSIFSNCTLTLKSTFSYSGFHSNSTSALSPSLEKYLSPFWFLLAFTRTVTRLSHLYSNSTSALLSVTCFNGQSSTSLSARSPKITYQLPIPSKTSRERILWAPFINVLKAS